MVQEYISQNYAAALSDKKKLGQLRSYIDKYLNDTGYTVEGFSSDELSRRLYSEMAEYSILTQYLGQDKIEEININGWDDIAITYTNGKIEKAKELLDNSDMSMKEICIEVGYSNPNYFSRIFKKTVGVTPTEYRI